MVEYIIRTPPLERLGAAVVEALAEGVTQQGVDDRSDDHR